LRTSTQAICLLFGPTHLLVIETKIGMIAPFPPPCLILPSLSSSSNHNTTTMHKFFSTMEHSSTLPRTPRTWTSSAPSIRLPLTIHNCNAAKAAKNQEITSNKGRDTGVIRDARTKLTLQLSLLPLLHLRLHTQ